MKRQFDNIHGTGESALSSVMITTNSLIGGKWFVVAGYGYCGRGLAKMAHGLGAKVIVTEIDSRRALEAHMDGYHVMTMEQAAAVGDIFVTTTGNTSIITEQHFKVMKDGAILSNAGHFNVEIDLEWLNANKEGFELRDSIETFIIGGKRINVLAEGRLVNLATTKGMGHPIEVMDLSFALQALCSEYIFNEGSSLTGGVYDVPNAIDVQVADLKLASLGIDIDVLTDEQKHYMNSWDIGT
jgi:adenosylhomocysteinase